MYCKKCGTEQKEGQKFCPKCGTPFQIKGNDNRVIDDSFHLERTEDVRSNDMSATNASKSKYTYYFIILVLAILGTLYFVGKGLLNSCSLNLLGNKEAVSDIEAIPFKSMEKGKWGLIKPDGTILFEEEFKDRPTVAREGRFMVKNGNGFWEVYTATDAPERVGDEYISIGDFYNGVAPAVKKNERISLIDKDGNVITVLEKSNSKEIIRMENFHYGYALFETEDGAVGIINTHGEILLPAQKYCKILHVAPNRFLALDMKYQDENDKRNYIFRVIDAKGNEKGTIRMHKYDDIAVLAEGYIGIEQTSDGESLFGIMDLEGEVILKPTSKIRGISSFQDGKFIFSDGENLGVRTVKDKVLIRAKYDGITWATDDLLWACSVNDGRAEWSLIDLEGNKITKDSYQSVLPSYDNKYAFVQITDKTWGIVNMKGEEIKGVPDIYIVSPMTADEVIVSDYVDIDAVISAVKMTPNGFGGFGINKSPVELLKVYNEFCTPNEKMQIDPASVSTDQLSYEREVIKGIRFGAKVYYSAYMTEQGESHYDDAIGEWIQSPKVWTKEKPQYVRMSVSGDKLIGRTKSLYKKLVSKAKTYGKVYKENENACIIMISDHKSLVLVNSGDEVWGIVRNDLSLKNEYIEQYSSRPTIALDTETIEEVVDSLY